MVDEDLAKFHYPLHHDILKTMSAWPRLVPQKRARLTDCDFLLLTLVAIVVPTMQFPKLYVNCPCTDLRQNGHDDAEQEGGTFNPQSPRANFSLYPLEHLLYCEDCQDIKCPRCVIEEIVCWYCPGCLLEVPTSTVKSEGGR